MSVGDYVSSTALVKMEVTCPRCKEKREAKVRMQETNHPWFKSRVCFSCKKIRLKQWRDKRKGGTK